MSCIRLLSSEQFQAARQFVLRHGRLLERQVWRALFEGASADGALRALRAYQNADGGFGNGLEPDLLCPSSSGIGAETALWYLWLLGNPDPALAGEIGAWAEGALDERGAIAHPPIDLADYPRQPWWEGDDAHRVLGVAGMLRLLRIEAPELTARATALLPTLPELGRSAYYGYPQLLFAWACLDDPAVREPWLVRLPETLAANRGHLPLFGRAWFWARALVDQPTLASAAADVVAALQGDGGLVDLYPELPYWRPLFTLDALALLASAGC